MIVEWLALSVAFISLIIALITGVMNYHTQRTSLIHDLASKRLDVYQRRNGEGEKAFEERIVNFYEYIALLTVKREIPWRISEELFLDDFKNLFEFHDKIIKENDCWNYIHVLAKRWKIENMVEPKLTKKEKENLFSKLEEIYESVQLGTIDNVILGLMFFSVATGLAALSLGIPRLFANRPYVLVGAIVLLVLIMPLIGYIYIYARAIFFKNGSFADRVWVISYLGGTISFICGIWLFLFIAWIYERWWIAPPWIPTTVTITLLVVSFLFAVFYISPRVWEYFEENCNHLLKRRKKELGIQNK